MEKKNLQLAALIFSVAVLSAGLGVGGGAILVPMLLLLFECDYRTAAAISLASIVPVALTGGISHLLLLEGRLPWIQLGGFILMIIFGSRIAGRWLHRMNSRFLQAAFGLFILIIGLKMIRAVNLPGALFNLFPQGSSMELLLLTLFGLAIGAVSVLLGVGCGLLIVPFLHFAFGYEIKTAITFSLLTIFFNTLNGTLIHRRCNNLEKQSFHTILPSALAGALTGTLISTSLPGETLKTAFGIFLLAMGVNFLLREAHRLLKKTEGAADETEPG